MRAFAILPAAGRSRRMGRPKALLPWGDTTLIQHVVRNWTASRVEHVLVVLHPDDVEMARNCVGAFTVQCDPPPPEMKDSIRRGLEAAAEVFQAGPGDVWLVAPADMPGITPEVINQVIAAYEQQSGGKADQPRIWAAEHAGRRGHPVLFPWTLAEEVARLPEDQGLKALLERYPVVNVHVDSAEIFTDVDTPEDYQRERPARDE